MPISIDPGRRETEGRRKRRFRFKNPLLSLDATVIDLCAQLFDWAHEKDHNESEDLQLAGFVIFNIREIVRVRGVEAFSKSQRAALSEIGKYLTEQCKQKNREDIWAEPLLNDLEFLVARFLDD